MPSAIWKYLPLLLLVFLSAVPARAEDYTSDSFILRDPVITVSGGDSEIADYELISSDGQSVIGESTSSSFTYRAGFLYYPIATTPVLSASAGDGSVTLTWSASVATLANITNYQVGVATVSGGPYTFTSAGDVLTYTQSGLTNGVTYYFKIKADAGTLTLARSSEVSATPSGSADSGAGSATSGSEKTRIPGLAFLTKALDRLRGCPARADLNEDCRVNLTDFSVAAYWWERPMDDDFRSAEREKLNDDGRVTLEDFSVIAYYWTG